MSEQPETLLTIEPQDNTDAAELQAADSGETLIQKEQRLRKRRAVIIGSCGFIVVLAVVLSLFIFHPFSKTSSKGSDGEDTVPYESVISGNSADKPDAQFYEKKRIPVQTADWQQLAYDIDEKGRVSVYDKNGVLDKDANMRALVLANVNPGLMSASGVLPAEANGFTSDISKETNEDGSLNPMFAYWTQEEFAYEMSMITESLLNPVFGGWDAYQMSFSKAGEKFQLSDKLMMLFSTRLQQENASKPASAWVPVYADWGNNDYGMADTLVDSQLSRWYGQMVDPTVDFAYDANTGQYSATLTSTVKFTAWTKDQKTVEKQAHLSLRMISNANGQANKISPYRMVVDSASLTVE